MKILVSPDSFKGSLTAREAAEAIAKGFQRGLPNAHIVCLPVADGGEGTLDALLAATEGRRVAVTVRGPLNQPVNAEFGFLGTEPQTAIIEMASASGLGLVPPEQRDPRRASTYGTGELIRAAQNAGATKIIIGLGGSATNDGGAGAMQALGIRFFDLNGLEMPRGVGGAALAQLGHIDTRDFHFPPRELPVVVASDVQNPLVGPNGASAVYGPQKGADTIAIAELDAALTHYAEIVRRDLGMNIATLPGGGVAGGLGAALVAFLGATIQSGIDLVLDTTGFDAQVKDADWIITGEGRIDSQTINGKAVMGILARRAGVPVIAFGGSVDPESGAILAQHGLAAAFPIVSGPMLLSDAIQNAAPLLEAAAERVARLISVSEPGVSR